MRYFSDFATLCCRVLYLRLDRRARGILNKGVGHEVRVPWPGLGRDSEDRG